MGSSGKLTLAGYYGYDNAGDELILQNILEGLKDYLPDYKIAVLTRHHNSRKSSEKVRYISRYNPLSILRSLITSRALIMGGGSLLQDASGCLTIYYYFFLMLLSRFLGKQLVIFNQGIGPINSPVNRFLSKIAFLITDLIIVRDEASAEYIRKITEKRITPALGADPVFYKLKTPVKRKENGTVGLALRKWKNHRVEEVFSNLSEKLKKETGMKIVNIPFHKGEDEVNAETVENIHWRTVRELEQALSKLDILIGMRLHALILGAAHNLPMIGIYYDPKVRSFCQYMGIDGISINEINQEILLEKFRETQNKAADYTEKLKELNIRTKESFRALSAYLID